MTIVMEDRGGRYQRVSCHLSVRGRHQERDTDQPIAGLQHTQSGTIVLGSDGRTVYRIKCVRCSNHGHHANVCPGIVTSEQHVNDVTTINISNATNSEFIDDITSEARMENEEVINGNKEGEDNNDDSLVIEFIPYNKRREYIPLSNREHTMIQT